MAHEVLFLQIVHTSGQTAANKLSTGHRVLFLQIAHVSGQTTANKLSTGHRVLFLQIAHVSGETGANKLSMCTHGFDWSLVVNINHKSTCEERTAKRFSDKQGGSLSLNNPEKFVHK